MPGQARPPKGEEHRIQNEVLAALGQRTDVRVWRANVGVARPLNDPSAVVRFGVPGQADISGILAGGRRLEVEIKAPGGVQSAQQRAFQTMITTFGGLYVVARSAAEAIHAVNFALGKGGTDAGSVPVQG